MGVVILSKAYNTHSSQRTTVMILQVSCGARHTVVLTDDGRALGCGCNKHGELGLGDDRVPLFTELIVPTPVADSTCKVLDMEAGWWHTTILVQS